MVIVKSLPEQSPEVESKKRTYEMMESVELHQEDVAGEEVVQTELQISDHNPDDEYSTSLNLTPRKEPQKVFIRTNFKF